MLFQSHPLLTKLLLYTFLYFCRCNRSIPDLKTPDHRLKGIAFSSLALPPQGRREAFHYRNPLFKIQ